MTELSTSIVIILQQQQRQKLKTKNLHGLSRKHTQDAPISANECSLDSLILKKFILYSLFIVYTLSPSQSTL